MLKANDITCNFLLYSWFVSIHTSFNFPCTVRTFKFRPDVRVEC
jgi:hypothetical protein